MLLLQGLTKKEQEDLYHLINVEGNLEQVNTSYQLVGRKMKFNEQIAFLLNNLHSHPPIRISLGISGVAEEEKEAILYQKNKNWILGNTSFPGGIFFMFDSQIYPKSTFLAPLTWSQSQAKLTAWGYQVASETQYHLDRPILVCPDNYGGHYQPDQFEEHLQRLLGQLRKHRIEGYSLRLHPKNRNESKKDRNKFNAPIMSGLLEKYQLESRIDHRPAEEVFPEIGVLICQHSSIAYEALVAGIPIMALERIPESGINRIAFRSWRELKDPDRRKQFEVDRRKLLNQVLKQTLRMEDLLDPAQSVLTELVDEYMQLREN